ncbi:MAG TPA: hypothetical protein DEF51_22055 [Myxococcales bacterium]|nr:hypothetical protein [Myxococcales bacterium]
MPPLLCRRLPQAWLGIRRRRRSTERFHDDSDPSTLADRGRQRPSAVERQIGAPHLLGWRVVAEDLHREDRLVPLDQLEDLGERLG